MASGAPEEQRRCQLSHIGKSLTLNTLCNASRSGRAGGVISTRCNVSFSCRTDTLLRGPGDAYATASLRARNVSRTPDAPSTEIVHPR